MTIEIGDGSRHPSTPDCFRYRLAIIDALAIVSNESDLDVMAGLLVRFADAGDTNAGDIRRTSLDHLPPGVLDNVGFRFVQLDGLPALPAFIMRLDDAGGNWLRAQAEEEFGVDAVPPCSPPPQIRVSLLLTKERGGGRICA